MVTLSYLKWRAFLINIFVMSEKIDTKLYFKPDFKFNNLKKGESSFLSDIIKYSDDFSDKEQLINFICHFFNLKKS
jgi:hypothetical protein